MHTLARRGIQAALVTGGLFMLGTGIASAQEDVNPDKPANPLDVSVNIPIHAQDNELATPLGKAELPKVKHDIKIPSVNEVTGNALDKADKQSGQQDKEAGSTDASKQTESPALSGNKATVNAAVPVQACGNSVGVLAESRVRGSCEQETKHDQDVRTDGKGGALSGNAVKGDAAVPVQASGNALGVLGKAKSDYTAEQETESTGNVTTNGDKSFAGGNALAASPALPVQLNGVSGGVLGHGDAHSVTENETETGGWLESSGKQSVLGGTAAGAPLAHSLGAQDIALGDANSHADGPVPISAEGGNHETEVTSGDGKPDASAIPMYASTNGEHSVLGGTTGAADAATPISACGIAGGTLGEAKADCAASEATKSGGATVTDGTDSLGGGSAVHGPVAFPANATGIGGGVLGTGTAHSANTSDVRAGGSIAPARVRTGNTFTNGNGSLAGANVVSAPMANSGDLCAVAGGVLGTGEADCANDVTGKAGGYDGTLGNESAAAGNIVTTPVTIPAEVLGAAVGNAKANSAERKDLGAGERSNSKDDKALGSSNILAVPASVPAQVFGVGAGGLGTAEGTAQTATTANAGGEHESSGDDSGLAGNIVNAPLATPAQAFGVSGGVLGAGHGQAVNSTESGAGGANDTTGKRGFGTGNIVTAPTGLVGQVFGDSLGVADVAQSQGVNETATTAGGDSNTNGSHSAASGNAVQAPIDPLVQVFGDAVGALASNHGDGINQVSQQNGGNVSTDGTEGVISGNIVPVAAQAVAGVFGDAVSVAGADTADGTSAVQAVNGGDSATKGEQGTISGNVLGAEAQPLVRAFGHGVGAIGAPLAQGVDSGELVNGGAHQAEGNGRLLGGEAVDVPAVVAPALLGNGVGALGGHVFGAGADHSQSSNSVAEPEANQLPVSVAPMAHDLELPILSEVTAEGVPGGEVTNAGEPVAQPLPGMNG